MAEPLKLLLIEDSDDDALLVTRALRQGGFEPTVARVQTAVSLGQALAQAQWDVLIADFSLPQFSATEALELLQASQLDLPFIVVSGTIGEQVAVELMRRGASDYVMKGSLGRLASAVRRELREAAIRAERRRIEAALQSLIEGTAALTGDAFFNALVKQIAQALGVHYVLVTELSNSQLHTLAYWGLEPLPPQTTTEHTASPSALVLREGCLCCTNNLQARFPNDASISALSAESYLGLALYDSSGHAFGTLSILDTAPLRAPELTANILRLFAARASAELERRQATRALEQLNRKLETMVEQRTAELRATNQQLALANQELAHATRLKDEFLATMSHELRTPLNAILGLSESLKEEVYGPLAQSQLGVVTMIEQSGSHLLALINDILDLSKISAGMLELTLEPSAVTFLCEHSLIFVKQQAVRKQISLRSHIQPELASAFIKVDERRVRQALINLLSNAVKFTPQGGHVELIAELSGDDAHTYTPWLRFQIVDNGIGIAPEHLDKLFKPFVQIDSSLNRQYNGSGLGLALVKQIAELHGGRVRVASRPGLGSCFSLELPAHLEDPGWDKH